MSSFSLRKMLGLKENKKNAKIHTRDSPKTITTFVNATKAQYKKQDEAKEAAANSFYPRHNKSEHLPSMSEAAERVSKRYQYANVSHKRGGKHRRSHRKTSKMRVRGGNKPLHGGKCAIGGTNKFGR